MHPSVIAAADSFKINTASFEQALENVQESDPFLRPMDKGNSVNFVVGHMVSSRFLVAQVIGVTEESPFGDLYRRGVEVKDASEYPSIDEIKQAWQKITPLLMKRLEDITEEELSAKPPFDVPFIENSVRGAVSFLAWHESTHLGQMAYLGRLLGDQQLFG